jgi:hypothetical protein
MSTPLPSDTTLGADEAAHGAPSEQGAERENQKPTEPTVPDRVSFPLYSSCLTYTDLIINAEDSDDYPARWR